MKVRAIYEFEIDVEGFEDALDIVQDEIPINAIKIGRELIEL